MKKLIFVLVLLLALPIGVIADVDLSGMTFDELVALRDQLNLAIWNSAEWQEITVPQGIWEVGKDIPAGHWTIHPVPNSSTAVYYGNSLKKNGMEVSWSSDNIYAVYLDAPGSGGYSPEFSTVESDIILQPGSYVEISSGSAVFSPYYSKPDLSFSGNSSRSKTPQDVVMDVLRSHADQLLVPNGRANRYVNLREEPNSKSKKVCSVSEGALIPIRTAYYTEKWHQSFYHGQICYVYADYVDLE